MMLAFTVANMLPLHRPRKADAHRCSTHGRQVLQTRCCLEVLISTSELPLHRPDEAVLTRGVLLRDLQMAAAFPWSRTNLATFWALLLPVFGICVGARTASMWQYRLCSVTVG